MKFSDYCMDKIIFILLNIVGMLCISEYLSMTGNTTSTIILIDILWFIILYSCIITNWYRRNKYFLELNNQVNALKQPWLVSEIMPASFRIEDNEYQKVIHNIGATVIEEIHRIEDEQKEYEEEGDFLPLSGQESAIVTLEKGDFLICYPEDAHMTAIKNHTFMKRIKG